jgi:hypothetical protein
MDDFDRFLRDGDGAVMLTSGTISERVVLGDLTPAEYLQHALARLPGTYMLECGGCDLAEMWVYRDGSAVLKEWLDESDDAGTRYVVLREPRFTKLPSEQRCAEAA